MTLGRAAERCPTHIFTLTNPSRIIQYDPSSNRRSQLPAGLERTYTPPGTQNLPLAVSQLSFYSSFSTSRAAPPVSPSQFVEKLFTSLILMYFAFLIISMKEVIGLFPDFINLMSPVSWFQLDSDLPLFRVSWSTVLV